MNYAEKWFALKYWVAVIGLGTLLLTWLMAFILAVKQDLKKVKEEKEKKEEEKENV